MKPNQLLPNLLEAELEDQRIFVELWRARMDRAKSEPSWEAYLLEISRAACEICRLIADSPKTASRLQLEHVLRFVNAIWAPQISKLKVTDAELQSLSYVSLRSAAVEIVEIAATNVDVFVVLAQSGDTLESTIELPWPYMLDRLGAHLGKPNVIRAAYSQLQSMHDSTQLEAVHQFANAQISDRSKVSDPLRFIVELCFENGDLTRPLPQWSMVFSTAGAVKSFAEAVVNNAPDEGTTTAYSSLISAARFQVALQRLGLALPNEAADLFFKIMRAAQRKSNCKWPTEVSMEGDSFQLEWPKALSKTGRTSLMLTWAGGEWTGRIRKDGNGATTVEVASENIRNEIAAHFSI